MHVRHTHGLDDIFNFETFSQSMMLLFQTSTSAGWDGVLAGLMNDQPPDCNATTTERRPMGDCGSTRLAILYLVTYLPAYLPAYTRSTHLVTYLVISFLVVINMYIAVILENFSQVRRRLFVAFTRCTRALYQCGIGGFKGGGARGPCRPPKLGPNKFQERPSRASRMKENLLAARTAPRTPLGEFTALPQPRS